MAKASRARFVLVGETHATPAHHQWQADVAGGILARGRPVVIGLEYLPRAAQPALDAFASGTTDAPTFERDSRWKERWGHSFAAYRPLFDLGQTKRLPMVALNVERAFVRRVAREGFTTAASAGAPIGRPAAPSAAYLASLRAVYAPHAKTFDKAAFGRFVEAQTVWDRAMAEAMTVAARRHPRATIVGAMGSGHVAFGHGVAHQLRALGEREIVTLIPAASRPPCTAVAGQADMIFGIDPGDASRDQQQ